MPCRRMGEGRYSSTILDISTRWRWVEGAPGTHWIGGCGIHRPRLHDVKKRKFSCLRRDRTPNVHNKSCIGYVFRETYVTQNIKVLCKYLSWGSPHEFAHQIGIIDGGNFRQVLTNGKMLVEYFLKFCRLVQNLLGQTNARAQRHKRIPLYYQYNSRTQAFKSANSKSCHRARSSEPL
jgi:hypothetical protein